MDDLWAKAGVTEAARRHVSQPARMFINGSFVEAFTGQTLDVFDPATNAKLTTIPRGSAEDVDLAVQAAKTAFEGGEWSRLSPYDRQGLLLKLADLLEADRLTMAQIETIDNGKPLNEAFIDVDGTVRFFRYVAGWATKIDGRTPNHSAGIDVFGFTRRKPIGPVGAITPWNFPLSMAGWKLAAPLAVGCPVVLKPAELTSLSALRLAELAQEAGFPNGAVNIVTGLGGEAGAALSTHPDLAKLAFTGSTSVGLQIAKCAAQGAKPATLELGGKSPMIVFGDCDPDYAVNGTAGGIFFNQGQVCTAGSRLYIHKSIYDEVVEGLGRYADAIRLGPGLATNVDMGPLISPTQTDRVVSYINSGSEERARPVTQNTVLPEGNGNFIRPVVFADTDHNMRIVKEEIFGPVLACAPFSDEDEAIRLANDSCYGLAASVWTNNLTRAHRSLDQLDAGILWANTHNPIDPSLPFGGIKLSGYGREMGPEQLDSYLTTRSVWIQLPKI